MPQQYPGAPRLVLRRQLCSHALPHFESISLATLRNRRRLDQRESVEQRVVVSGAAAAGVEVCFHTTWAAVLAVYIQHQIILGEVAADRVASVVVRSSLLSIVMLPLLATLTEHAARW